MITILSALFVLGVLVFVHELGHFIVAKLSGIKVEKFSLGFPPTAISKKVGDTEYCLSWLPLGGYVKMAGEDPSKDELTGAGDEFLSKPPLVKMAVVLAGPIMNFILAIFIFWIIFYFGGKTITSTTKIEVADKQVGLLHILPFENGDSLVSINGEKIEYWQDFVEKLTSSAGEDLNITIYRDQQMKTLSTHESFIDHVQEGDLGIYPFMSTLIENIEPSSPASKVGLKEGDIILAVNDTKVNTFHQLRNIITKHPGDTIAIQYQRNKQIFNTDIVPRSVEVPNAEGGVELTGQIGILGHIPFSQIKLPFWGAWKAAFQESVNKIFQMVDVLKKLVTNKISPKHMGGPIYIFQLSGKFARAGFMSLLSFMALISLNLGLVNLLPIPALDGGHFIVFIIEAVLRKPLNEKQLTVIQYVGVGCIILLTVLVMYNDIMRLIR